MSSEKGTTHDWELFPEKYATDASGNFLLKKDGTPRKKSGRAKGSKSRGYNYSSKTKARMSAERAVRNKRRRVETVEAKLRQQKNSLNNSKELLKKLDNKSNNKITTTDVIEDSLPRLQKEVKDNILFKPNDGPQTEFLAAPEIDVLYGGSAGGGKSYAMLVDPLRYAHRAAHRALILRRSMPELRELIDKSRELYPQAFPGCKFREVEKLWNFPSGAKVEFGFLERDADVYRYQGQAYSWIAYNGLRDNTVPSLYSQPRRCRGALGKEAVSQSCTT